MGEVGGSSPSIGPKGCLSVNVTPEDSSVSVLPTLVSFVHRHVLRLIRVIACRSDLFVLVTRIFYSSKKDEMAGWHH